MKARSGQCARFDGALHGLSDRILAPSLIISQRPRTAKRFHLKAQGRESASASWVHETINIREPGTGSTIAPNVHASCRRMSIQLSVMAARALWYPFGVRVVVSFINSRVRSQTRDPSL